MDKRTENGGHSTKAKGIDKRQNKYLRLLDEASTEEEIIQVLKTLKDKAINEIRAMSNFIGRIGHKVTEYHSIEERKKLVK